MEDLVKTGGLGNIAKSRFLESMSLDWYADTTSRIWIDPYTELPTETRVRIRMNAAYQNSQLADAPNGGLPQFQFNTSNIATKTFIDSVGSSALETIRVVPNPYYGFSAYEGSQLDNIVKITNLPENVQSASSRLRVHWFVS